MNVLLKRCRKLYCMDLVSSLRRKEGPFWDRTGKTPVFLVEPWLAQLSVVEPATLSVILGWHLLDLVPREAVEPAVERLYSLLQPGGVMFYLLREPYLAAGADATFELDGLKTIVAKGTGSAPFPNPVLPTRELEKFVPAAKLKTFLTRSGRREIVVMK